MKLTWLGQIVVGGSILLGGIATPILQNTINQESQLGISENWIQLTLAQLAYYDGTSGKPAYIAYQGDIYDVTNASGWSNGRHEGMHLAGQDCTTILQSASHGTGVLAQLTRIGEVVDQVVSSSITTSVTSSEGTTTTETCQWIEIDDARRSRDDDDDDHDDDDDDDDHDEEEDDEEEDDDDDDDDDDGYWSCTNTTSSGTSSTSIPNTPSEDGKYYLTLAELAYYDGTNGKPAWVAIFGDIYDVTRESGWSRGVHRGMHLAGTDASAAFDDSPHSRSLLNSLTNIGYLI